MKGNEQLIVDCWQIKSLFFEIICSLEACLIEIYLERGYNVRIVGYSIADHQVPSVQFILFVNLFLKMEYECFEKCHSIYYFHFQVIFYCEMAKRIRNKKSKKERNLIKKNKKLLVHFILLYFIIMNNLFLNHYYLIKIFINLKKMKFCFFARKYYKINYPCIYYHF